MAETMMVSTFVVEFTGSPGAGKTTSIHEVIAELNGRGYCCPDKKQIKSLIGQKPHSPSRMGQIIFLIRVKVRRLLSLGRFLLGNIPLIFWSITYALRVTPVNIESVKQTFLLLKSLNSRRLLKHAAKRNGYDILVLDKGIIQSLWSVVITGNPPPHKYLKQLLIGLRDKLPEVVVLFEIDGEIAIERIQSRPTMTSRFDQMPAHSARRTLDKHKDYFRNILDCAVDISRIDLLTVNGSLELSENAARISNFVVACYDQLKLRDETI